MDGIKISAINLKSKDTGEDDKLLTLFTADSGKLSARIKGVKKAAAKLKFATQPFCFGEYILSRRGDNYVVTNCTLIEPFSELSADLEKFYCACALLEFCDNFSGSEKNPALFVSLLKGLKIIAFEDICPKLSLCHSLLAMFKVTGYGLTVFSCVHCGGNISRLVYFSKEEGGFCCGLCPSGLSVTPAVYNAVRLIEGTGEEGIATVTIEQEQLIPVLRLLADYIGFILGTPFKSISQLLKFSD